MANIGYYALRVLTYPLSRLPLGFHRKMGGFVGWLAGSVLHYRNDVVYTNLARSFPNLSYDDIKPIAKEFYRHFGTIFCEAIWFGGSDARRIRESHVVEISNPELLNKLYSRGKSVMILSSHNGNWELTGGYESYFYKEAPACSEDDICVVYHPMTSKAWDRFMNQNRIHPIRNRAGFKGLIPTFGALRYVFSNRDSSKVYLFITDQLPYTDSEKKIMVDFMHRRTYTMDGAVAIARKFGMSIVYMNMPVKDDGNYSIDLTLLEEDASGCDLADVLQRYYDLLQKDLEAQPWNYLWTHKRWR